MSLNIDHLLGVSFKHGSDDCYGLARRFYKDNFGLSLPNYARPDGWWDLDMDLYMVYFHDAGFRVIDVHPRDWRPGDAFLMTILAQRANHCALYLGSNEILHHPYGRFSEKVLYSGPWRNRTVAVLRHKDIQEQQVAPAPKFNLLDALPEHKKRELGMIP